MTQVPVAEGDLHLAERRAAADRQPVHRVRHRHVPRAGLVPALRVDRRWPSTCSRGAGRLWAWTTQDFPPPSPPYAGPTGQGLRAVRRRLRRAARRGEGRGAAHRVRSRRARDRHGDGAGGRAVPHRRRRQRGRDVRVPAGRAEERRSDGRRCDRRRGAAPVRPLPGRDRRSTWARSRSGARSPTRASSGATSSSRSPAATRSTTPTRSSRCSGSPASRSPTCTTAARPRRAR